MDSVDLKPVSLWRQTFLPFFSLFTSVGTLICCALPALLVTLGLGASLAGLIGAAPWIATLTDYKLGIFIGAGVMLSGAAYMQWQARYAPCPADPLKAKACAQARKMSWVILNMSIVIYIVGFFFAFLAADLLL